MKHFLSPLSSLGLVAVLIIGTSSSTSADSKQSPLRGAWSFSQFVPTTTNFGTPTPIPTASAGTLFMNADNSFTGHAVLDTPLPLPQPTFELDFQGKCTFRQGDARNGMDCTLDVPAFGLSDVGRYCVVMGGRGECFDEFRCVDTNEAGTVLLVEFRRQSPGACQ